MGEVRSIWGSAAVSYVPQSKSEQTGPETLYHTDVELVMGPCYKKKKQHPVVMYELGLNEHSSEDALWRVIKRSDLQTQCYTIALLC